jgi:hypothetical protein
MQENALGWAAMVNEMEQVGPWGRRRAVSLNCSRQPSSQAATTTGCRLHEYCYTLLFGLRRFSSSI